MRGRTPSAVQGRDRETGGNPPVPAEATFRDRLPSVKSRGLGQSPILRKFGISSFPVPAYAPAKEFETG